MKNIDFTKKAVVQAVFVGGMAVAMIALGVSQRTAIGQAYSVSPSTGMCLAASPGGWTWTKF